MQVELCTWADGCTNKKSTSYSRKGTPFPMKFCTKHWGIHCRSRSRVEDEWTDDTGYCWKRYDGEKAVAVHRYVMEQKLGRKLKKFIESVHHINGIRMVTCLIKY